MINAKIFDFKIENEDGIEELKEATAFVLGGDLVILMPRGVECEGFPVDKIRLKASNIRDLSAFFEREFTLPF